MIPLLQVSLTLLGTLLLASGCTKQTMAPEDLAKMKTKTYPNLSSDSVLHAASDLFFLADNRAFEQTQTQNRFVAVRKHSLDIGLTFVEAKDTWKIETKKTSQGTQVRLDARSDESWISGKTEVQRPEGPATYQHFWNRLDYLLGQSTIWMTCGDLNNQYLDDQTWGDTWWLCGEVADRTPPELIGGTWETKKRLPLSPKDDNDCNNQVQDGVYGKAMTPRQEAVYRSICLQSKGYKQVSRPTESL